SRPNTASGSRLTYIPDMSAAHWPEPNSRNRTAATIQIGSWILRRFTSLTSAGPSSGSAGSGRLGEHLVQDAAALLPHGHEPAVVTRELGHGRVEMLSECHGTAVGELPLRRGPGGDHDARRCRPQCRDV